MTSRRNFISAALFGALAGKSIIKGKVTAGNPFKPKPTTIVLHIESSDNRVRDIIQRTRARNGDSSA